MRGDADGGVGIFAVDVEDGDGQTLGDVGGEARGVGLFGVRGEAEEVVGDDVHGAADVVAGERGEVEGLGGDALAGEGCVAVQDDGEDLLLAFLADADLVGAGAAHDDGIDGLEVAGVGGEMQFDGLAAGRVYSPVAPMWYFTSPPPRVLRGIDVFKLGEDLGG